MRLAFGLFGGFLVAFACLVTPGVASAAPITIDQFQAPNPPAFSFASVGGINPAIVTTTHGSILGGARTLTTTVGSPPGGIAGSNALVFFGSSGVVGSSGFLNFNSSGLTGSTLDIAFGTDAVGGAAVGDLSGLGIGIDFAFLSGGVGVTDVSVDITLDTATGPLSFTGDIPVSAGAFTFLAPYALFVGPGSVAAVDGFTIRFNNDLENDVDFQINGDDGIRILEVPEPTTLALLTGMIGVTGLWYSRRRRVRSA